jgi:TPR repeat protein
MTKSSLFYNIALSLFCAISATAQTTAPKSPVDSAVLHAIKAARTFAQKGQYEECFALLNQNKNNPTFLSDTTATGLLGILYYSGNGTMKDEEQALKWLKHSADMNCANSMATLGLMYYSGDGIKQDAAKAFKYLKKAAERDNITSMGLLAFLYMKGNGTPTNEKEAIKWLRKGAISGNVFCFTQLAEAYEEGKGVSQDFKETFKLYKNAATKGDDGAAAELGRCYLDAIGTAEDEDKALEWIEKSHKNGSPSGTRMMAILYRDGRCGKPKDIAKSNRLRDQAAKNGDKVAKIMQVTEEYERKTAENEAAEAAARQERYNQSNQNYQNNRQPQQQEETTTMNTILQNIKKQAPRDGFSTIIEEGKVEARSNYQYNLVWGGKKVRVVLIIPYRVSNQTPCITASHIDKNGRHDYFFKSDYSNVQTIGDFTVIELNYTEEWSGGADYNYNMTHNGYFLLLTN